MSEVHLDEPERLTSSELVARIERQQAETRKFVAEMSKLTAESFKLNAETSKLNAEASKLNRDRLFAPFAILCATVTAIAALAPWIIRALAG